MVNGQLQSAGRVPVLVDEHIACECGCKIQEQHCKPFQRYNKDECECVCINHTDQLKCAQVRKIQPQINRTQ